MGVYKIQYTPRWGERIIETARNMVALAREQQVPVGTTFNDIRLVAKPETTPEEIVADFFSKLRGTK